MTCQALNQHGKRCTARKGLVLCQYHGDSELYNYDGPEPGWLVVSLCPQHKGKIDSLAESKKRDVDSRNDQIKLLRDALETIKEIGYDSQAHRATETVLACIRIAENALL